LQKLDQQSFINRQSKLRIKNNIENSRSFFHASNAHQRQSLKEESELNEKSIKDFQEELADSRIKQRKISQK
jgi:predicted HTH domain antitoxin